jgi:choline dehydrogenase
MTDVNTIPLRVDVLVIGAGTGGAALAGVLAENSDLRILLVDAGPDYGAADSGNWPDDMLDGRSIPLSHDYDLKTSRSSGTGVLDLPRAKIVGGCSAHNGCTVSVGAREDYDEWARLGNPSWSADRVEGILDWVHERFRTRRYAMAELTSPQHAFVEAGIAVGLPFADDLDDLDAAEGIGPMPVNIYDGRRWNSSFAFLDDVRGNPNLTILGDTQVTRLDVQDGQAHGAFLIHEGAELRVEAARVVVAAGAYHSPALLLRSGIGPAAELGRHGVPVVTELPGVGEHLLDHACVQLDFAGKAGLVDELANLDWNPDEQTVGRMRSSLCDDGPYDIHVFMVAGANSGHPGLPPISLYGGAMRARSEGTVRLPEDLDVSRPVIDHRYGSDPAGHDRTVLREALDLLEKMVVQPGLVDVIGERVTPKDRDPLDDIVNYCHPAGSCKMGPADDPLAVVGDDGKVHGVDGLYVADASIMPAITRGNINLPTAMIGAHVATMMLQRTPADLFTNASGPLVQH